MGQAGSREIEVRENDRLESWLEKRKLDGLLQDQLESRLESTLDAKDREQIAKRLATLYGKRLLSVDGDSQELLKQTRELISLYPRFESGRLRVAMLHARYLDSEKMFRDWIRAGAGVDEKTKLESILQRLEEDLSNALSALLRRSEELFSAGQLSRDRRDFEVERQTVEAEALHCQFLAGWSSYFLAMMREKDRAALLDQSELRFREFLQLDQQTMLVEYDSRWFDFSSAWHVRAIAGLAAIGTARGEESTAMKLYKLIEANAMTRDSREAVIRFRFLGNCYCGKYDAATNVVRDRKGIAAMSRGGRIRLWVAAVETLRASGSTDLRQLALNGLTRNMAGELLVQEYEKSSKVETVPNSFEACWIAGYAEFWKSENGEPNSAAKARQLLKKAVSLESDSNRNDVARCRYLLAWLLLKQNEIEPAIGMFAQAADQLSNVDPQLASESAWLAAKNALRRGGQDASRVNDAWNRLERFVRTWPDSPHANRASFEKLKIELRSMPATDAIRRLNEISPNDENHGASLLETAAQRYRLWQSQPSNQNTFEKFRNSCNEASSSRSTNAGQKLRANFLLIDATLRTNGDSEQVVGLLEKCATIVEQVEEPELAQAELLYYRMQSAIRLGDADKAYDIAAKIAEVGKGTRFELPGLIQMAQYLDASLAGENADTETLDAAIAVYRRLSQRLGSETEKLKSSANARIALTRLGELQQLDGQSVESESNFQILVDSFPGNANYLRNLAIAKSGRDVDGAKQLWQRIASGSEAGTDLWFESKLELARILANQDRASAVKLLKQTMQLGGKLPDVWQQPYDVAIERFSQSKEQ